MHILGNMGLFQLSLLTAPTIVVDASTNYMPFAQCAGLCLQNENCQSIEYAPGDTGNPVARCRLYNTKVMPVARSYWGLGDPFQCAHKVTANRNDFYNSTVQSLSTSGPVQVENFECASPTLAEAQIGTPARYLDNIHCASSTCTDLTPMNLQIYELRTQGSAQDGQNTQQMSTVTIDGCASGFVDSGSIAILSITIELKLDRFNLHRHYNGLVQKAKVQ